MRETQETETKRVSPALRCDPRRLLVYELKNRGVKFREIGERLGITANKANHRYHEEVWRRSMPRGRNWWDGLSVRATNCLANANLCSRKAVLKAFKSGRLRPNVYRYNAYGIRIMAGSTRNYGWNTHKEVAKWLGLPEPVKPAAKTKVPLMCPHCRKLIV